MKKEANEFVPTFHVILIVLYETDFGVRGIRMLNFSYSIGAEFILKCLDFLKG